MKTYYVYLLKCADGSYYTGVTGNLPRRLEEHQQGQRRSTRQRLPIQLAFCTEFSNLSAAISSELEIKSWPRIKKETLIVGGKKQLKRKRRTPKRAQLAFQL